MGRKEGQKGFDRTNMMILFSAHTEKSGKNAIGDPVGIRRQLTSSAFNEKYSISGAEAIGSLDGNVISRIPASVLSINMKNPSAFFDAITYVEIPTLESWRKEAVETMNSSYLGWILNRGIDKLRYFDNGKRYDIKSKLLKGRAYLYVKGIGIVESDYIGNLFYGTVMSNYQSLNSSLMMGISCKPQELMTRLIACNNCWISIW